MQINESDWTKWLTVTDAVDVWIRRRGRIVVDFVVNYRADLGDGWSGVLRYDTSHGQRLHVHRLWRTRHAVERLEPARRTDYRGPLAAALEDVQANWRRYRSLAEARRGGGP